jgi:hypothetical protein
MLSPWYSEHTGPLLEVLEAKKTLETVVDSSKELEVKKLGTECVLLCNLPTTAL